MRHGPQQPEGRRGRAGSLMRWRSTRVQGRPAVYGEGSPSRGSVSSPVVFLHGWALSDRTYRHALEQLVRRGHTVLAPALPGFRGTAEVTRRQFSLAGYGD